jgi:hypothetical protein
MKVIERTTVSEKPELLDQKEAADYLGLTPGTLAAWRSRRQPGPAYIKAGGRVRYHVKDLSGWLESRRVCHEGR